MKCIVYKLCHIVTFIGFTICNSSISFSANIDNRKVIQIIEKMNHEDSKSVLNASSNTRDLNVITSIKAYLNSIKTMKAKFIQISPDGSHSEGDFFLSRPGKLRWHYNPPTPVLIIINGNNLIYYDYELNEVSYTKPHNILGSFLTAEKIDFDNRRVYIDHMEIKNNIIRIYVMNKEIKNQKMIMVFNHRPMELIKIELLEDNQMTSISFHDSSYNIDIDKSLFIFKNPRIFGKQN